ncbi:hypothetical protein [Sinomonas susongensis]|uniref:hypothetical protein n=1 Tax=Sinomonas susongensis TaxID=1324851 RepID=UPI001107E633|nr:hypothetical protein [Sinomonas susongensis]
MDMHPIRAEDRRAWPARERRAGQTQAVMVLALLCQFLLGMAVNLFVKIPEDHPGAKPPEYFDGVAQSVTWAIADGGVWLAAHAAFGLVLVLGAAFAVAQAARSGSRAPLTTSIVGLVAVLGAGFNGGSYLNYGEDFSSMIMASLFAVATASYAAGAYLTRPAE